MKDKIFFAFLIFVSFFSIFKLQASNIDESTEDCNQAVKGLSLNDNSVTDEIDEDSEDSENYQYQPPESVQKLPIPPLFKQELKDINTQLALNKYPNFSEYTPFSIPFYRGVHYLKELFPDSNSRNSHRHNAKAGSPLFCSAAYTLCDKSFLDQDIDRFLLEKNSRLIAKVLGEFKTNYSLEYYKFHEIYSNDHVKFHKNLKNILLEKIVPNTVDPLYSFYVYKSLFNDIIGIDTQIKKNAFKRNPFVSCSMTIEHALKYGFGLKSFNGTPIKPDYLPSNKPTHPHLGMLYVIMLDPLSLFNINPTSIIEAQQQKHLQISFAASNNILSEYEVSFFGWIPPQYVFSTISIRVPTFRNNQMYDYHNQKYGLKDSLIPDNKIFDKISKHLMSIIERKVQDELTIKYPTSSFYQVYWRPDRKFGFSLISSTIVLALREQNIILSPKNGQQKIDSQDLEYLGEMLLTSQHKQVEIKDYTKNRQYKIITPPVISSLAQSLQSGTITHLTLKNMGISNILEQKYMFWSMFLHNNKLQYLDLSSNQMGDNSLLFIANGLFHNQYLKTLKIGGNADSNTPANTLSLALVDNKTLTELDYSFNKLLNGRSEFCTSLSQNSTLRILNLSGNSISDDYCKVNLIKLTNLTDLNLANNLIRNDNTKKILNKSLNKLKITY